MLKLLIGITCLGGLLRLVNLNDHPAGFTPDEAAFGYNAFSLLQTGRDEWATPFFALPYSGLLSFGDDKSPLYAILTVPAVLVFGLSHFSVRLPNAVLGTLTTPVIFLLANKLFSPVYSISARRSISLLASLLFSLSPWSIQLSRGAFEANLVLFFLPLAIVALLNQCVILAAIMSALSVHAYHSGKLLAIPALLLFIPAAKLKTSHIQMCLALILFLLLPTLHSSFTRPNSRMMDISIFSPDDQWAEVVKNRYQAILSGTPDFLARLIHNRPRAVLQKFAGNYLEYFSPAFLFLSGPREATYGMVKGWGVVLPAFAIGVPLGAYLVFLKRSCFAGIIGLLLMSPFPAALTKGPGLAANRAALLLLPLTLLAALGVHALPPKIRSFLIFFSLIYSGAAVFNYHCCSQSLLARDMLFGYRELFSSLSPLDLSSGPVLISRSLSEPHIFVAFYTQISPVVYQKNSQSWRDFQSRGFKFLDQMDGYQLQNFTFGSIPPTIPPETLVISRPAESNPASQLVARVFYPNSTEVSVQAYKIRP